MSCRIQRHHDHEINDRRELNSGQYEQNQLLAAIFVVGIVVRDRWRHRVAYLSQNLDHPVHVVSSNDSHVAVLVRGPVPAQTINSKMNSHRAFRENVKNCPHSFRIRTVEHLLLRRGTEMLRVGNRGGGQPTCVWTANDISLHPYIAIQAADIQLHRIRRFVIFQPGRPGVSVKVTIGPRLGRHGAASGRRPDRTFFACSSKSPR